MRDGVKVGMKVHNRNLWDIDVHCSIFWIVRPIYVFFFVQWRSLERTSRWSRQCSIAERTINPNLENSLFPRSSNRSNHNSNSSLETPSALPSPPPTIITFQLLLRSILLEVPSTRLRLLIAAAGRKSEKTPSPRTRWWTWNRWHPCKRRTWTFSEVSPVLRGPRSVVEVPRSTLSARGGRILPDTPIQVRSVELRSKKNSLQYR